MAFATGINLETGKTELFDFINVSKSGTYKGLWDASTNTPFLTNGTGEDGDYYEVSVGGTVNFGEGDIIFVAGDTVAYSRGKWQKGDKPLINDEEITYDTTWSSAKILQVIETASTADVYTYKGETTVLPDGTEETPNNKGDVWLLTTDGLPYWWDGDIWRRFGVDAYTKTETENVIEEKLKPVKTKLETIEEGAEVNSIKSISVNDTEIVPDKDKNVNIVVPTKVSDIENDSEFITKAVNDLVNYYKKSETYTQQEIKNLISVIESFKIKIVDVLPETDIDTHAMYFVPKSSRATTQDSYDTYIYINGVWELVGSTDINLDNYYTKDETYSQNEVDDSGLCAHGDNAPFLTNSTITDYLTGLDAKYKFATFTVDQDNATVSDKVNTTQWFSYNCYRQNNSWRVTAADSSTGKEIYTTDISAGNPVSWSKLATTDNLIRVTENEYQLQVGGENYAWFDLGTSPNTGNSQAYLSYEITYGRVDGLQSKTLVSCGGTMADGNYFKIIDLNNAETSAAEQFKIDNNKHLWLGMQSYCRAYVKVYGRWSGMGDKTTVEPTGTILPIYKLATKSDLTASTDITLTTYANSAFSIIELKAVRLGLNTIQVAGILEINSQCETLTFASGLPTPKVVTLSPHLMQIQAMCYRGTSSGASERVLINKNGSMTVYTNTSGGNLYFSCEYTYI